MPRLPFSSVVAAGLLLTACGTTGVASSDSVTATAPEAAFPVTIERTGGIAGFRDRIVVDESGRAMVTSPKGESTCRLDEATMAAVRRLAGDVGGTPSPTTAPVADAIVVRVSTPDGVRVLDAGNLPGTAPQVGLLLDDLRKPVAERTTCT